MQLRTAGACVCARVAEKLRSTHPPSEFGNREKLMAGDRRRGYHFFTRCFDDRKARNSTRRLYRLRWLSPISKHFIVEPHEIWQSNKAFFSLPSSKNGNSTRNIRHRARSLRVAAYLILFSSAGYAFNFTLFERSWVDYCDYRLTKFYSCVMRDSLSIANG